MIPCSPLWHSKINSVPAAIGSLFRGLLLTVVLFGVINGVSSQDIEVVKLPFNTGRSSQIAPFYHDSVLYYSSNQRQSVFISYTDDNGEPLYRLYQSVQLPDSGWSKPDLFDKTLQSPFQNGSITMTDDGSVVVLTRSKSEDIKSAEQSRKGDQLGLYICRKKGDKWGRMSLLPFSKGRDFSMGQASISPDGRYIFYVTNGNGTLGGSDIYLSENIAGEWSEPRNLGDRINTTGNEVFPFYHSSGKLYFASDGRGGLGGLDLYSSRMNADGSFADPVALKAPVNSEYDDFGCYVGADEMWGFIASNRDGKDELFRFNNKWPLFNACEPQVDDSFCFTFYDDGPYKSDTVSFLYRWNFGDGQTGDGLEVDHCYAKPGSYRVMLSAVDMMQNKELMVVADYQLDLERTRQVYISGADSSAVGVPVLFDVARSFLPGDGGSEFFWDMGDGTRIISPKVEHVYSKPGEYVVTCGTIINETGERFCSSRKITILKE